MTEIIPLIARHAPAIGRHRVEEHSTNSVHSGLTTLLSDMLLLCKQFRENHISGTVS